ncbi:TRAP transporter small permease [Saccharospirillum mangrovi]|uniref:TRAP transporter small permease n=1 Tax=Saccharospirillum mangrovi TaxID=2161747 RepID=UPI000D3B69C1|nr:TRAP transporter small permease [Saccharospirillum mangrovi]
MKGLWRLDAALARLETGLLALSLFIMIGLAVLQIGLRNLVGTSWFWIDPANRLLVLWLALLGALVATRRGEHIAIDALRHYVRGVGSLIIERAATAFAAMLTGMMAWQSTRFVIDEFQFKTTTFAELPAWPFELIMPVAFGLMALRFAGLVFVGRPEVRDV